MNEAVRVTTDEHGHILQRNQRQGGGLDISAAQYRLPSAFDDGWLVLAEGLRRGLDVLMLPRQVLLAGYGQVVPTRLAFAHGVPAASTMSAVTFCQDKRLRRALLQRAGITVPKGATFSIRSLQRAIEFAERTGYPVVLKEAVGENPSKVATDITSADGLHEAFDTMRLRNRDAGSPGRSLEIAGYAQTRLKWETDEQGREVSPRRTRFLVEKQLAGRVIRIFSSEGTLQRAIAFDSEAHEWRDVTERTADSLYSLANAARRAIPGLAAASVDIVTPDESLPTLGPEVAVTELSERPRVTTYRSASPEVGLDVAGALLRLQADAAEQTLDRPQEQPVKRAALVDGLTAPDSAAAAMTTAAAALEVDLSRLDPDPAAGTLSCQMQGTAHSVAWLMESLMGGFGIEDKATSVHLTNGSVREGVPAEHAAATATGGHP